MSDYSDFSIHKWDDYPVLAKKTPEQEHRFVVYNRIYHAISELNKSRDWLPPEATNMKVSKAYMDLESMLEAGLEEWGDR